MQGKVSFIYIKILLSIPERIYGKECIVEIERQTRGHFRNLDNSWVPGVREVIKEIENSMYVEEMF